MKKYRKVIIWMAVLAIMVVSANVPRLFLREGGMTTICGKNVLLHTCPELNTTEIIQTLDTEIQRINAFYDVDMDGIFYLYSKQNILHRKKYGLFIDVIKLVVNLDWYIGDNRKDVVIAVSPDAALAEHNRESVMGMLPHEYVHTVNYRLNPEMTLWHDEGLALYLTNGEELESTQGMYLPSYEEIGTSNPITFAKINGYQLAHNYIDFMVKTYGVESVKAVTLNNLPYEDVLNVTEEEFYTQWLNSIQQ